MPMHEIFPYQDEAARLLASRRTFGLHDEMGIGKTATCIRGLDYLNLKRGIVVAPASGRAHWHAEFKKFAQRRDIRVVKGVTKYDYDAWRVGRFDVLVTSYEQAVTWTKLVLESMLLLDFVIFDEAHYLKDVTRQRAKTLLGEEVNGLGGISMLADYKWHVTGTPMFNDPMDIYPFLKMCGATRLERYVFMLRYFNRIKGAYSVRTEAKEEMVPELRALIAANSIRRTKKDVGLQLPPIFITETEIDGDTTEIKELLLQHPELETAIIRAVELGGLSNLDHSSTSTLRRLIGEAKAIPYGEMLLDELHANRNKRVVFGLHVQALTSLKRYLEGAGIKAVLYNGGTSEKEREKALRAFKEDDDCLVFIGNIKAAGTVINLISSFSLDMLESDWTPGGNAQAIFRVHRVGQKSTVFVRFIGLAKTLDTVVVAHVARKTSAIASLDNTRLIASPIN